MDQGLTGGFKPSLKLYSVTLHLIVLLEKDVCDTKVLLRIYHNLSK